jgi:plastocyanin
MTARTRLLVITAFALLGACSGGGSGSSSGDGLNSCASQDFVTGGSSNTINFGGMAGSPLFNYAPRCLRVPKGAQVTFSGSFTVHPISPGTRPQATTAGSPNNPIPQTQTGTSITVQFPAAGTYPFFCQEHYAAGMSGVVEVTP